MIRFVKKYFMSGGIIFYLSTFCLALLFCIAGYYSEMQYRSLQLKFVLNSEQNATFEIYFDVGRGLTESDRQSWQIE